jgi:hypothetical protein
MDFTDAVKICYKQDFISSAFFVVVFMSKIEVLIVRFLNSKAFTVLKINFRNL